MFSVMSSYAKGISQLFLLMVNITLKGQMFEIAFGACFISPTFSEGFSYVYLKMISSLKQCTKGLQSATLTQGQGHTI